MPLILGVSAGGCLWDPLKVTGGSGRALLELGLLRHWPQRAGPAPAHPRSQGEAAHVQGESYISGHPVSRRTQTDWSCPEEWLGWQRRWKTLVQECTGWDPGIARGSQLPSVGERAGFLEAGCSLPEEAWGEGASLG